jgi:hypothetical protein
MRKLTQEEGPPRLNDRIENLPFVCEAVAQLPLCTSAEQFAQLAEIVLDELRARKEDRFADYVIRTGSGYFVKPWNRWFIGAPRITLKDGGRSGSDIAYHNIGPTTNPGERYNLILQDTVLLNKRSSKEHLLGKALPEQMLLDATDRAGTVPMCLAVLPSPPFRQRRFRAPFRSLKTANARFSLAQAQRQRARSFHAAPNSTSTRLVHGYWTSRPSAWPIARAATRAAATAKIRPPPLRRLWTSTCRSAA